MNDSDARYYDRADELEAAAIARMVRTIEGYYRRYSPQLEERLAGRRDVRTLELGAGSCALSLLVSRHPAVAESHCSDISVERMRVLAPVAATQLQADAGKLRYSREDLGETLPFADRSVDLILFDASLHHSRSMWRTLSECRRVVRDDGLVIAQREQFVARLTAGWKMRALLDSEEVRSGVSENAYLKEQYEYYFRACGLAPRFVACPETPVQRLLGPLNGWIMSKWTILAGPSR